MRVIKKVKDPNVERKMHKLDAEGLTVGRLATKIATILRGKNKPEYMPHQDNGDVVEVANASKLKFTGNKLEQAVYYHHSGFQGGLKTKKVSDVFAKDPGEVLRHAVKSMLPATRLRPQMMRRLIIRK